MTEPAARASQTRRESRDSRGRARVTMKNAHGMRRSSPAISVALSHRTCSAGASDHVTNANADNASTAKPTIPIAKLQRNPLRGARATAATPSAQLATAAKTKSDAVVVMRSEERRVGKGGRGRE